MINGHTVQQTQVENLFHSVQLNVNNPHFLIMQGRITKVLNMKPMETLSMIEEAAGTRMFETKKQAAIRTIEKKQLKVEELSRCMNDEITPTLDILRREAKDYQTWLSNNAEVERLEKFCVASIFRDHDHKIAASESQKQAMILNQKALNDEQRMKSTEAEECSQKIRAMEIKHQLEEEGSLQDLKKQEADLSKELVKLNSLFHNQKDVLSLETELNQSLTRQLDESSSTLMKKQADLKIARDEYITQLEVLDRAEKRAADFKEKYQNAVAGIADDSNTETRSLPEQVATWEKRAREAQSKLKQGRLVAAHAQENLKELRLSLKIQQVAHDKVLKESDNHRYHIAELQRKLNEIHYDENEEVLLRSSLGSRKMSAAELRDNIDNLTTQLETRLAFVFADPEKNFDRSKVKGLIARLIRVKDRNTSTALEIVAGAKLYQVVVDTEQTGKLLLQKGNLRKRVTILPLNKISSRCVDANRVRSAQKVAAGKGGNATLALELVGFDDEVKRAMEFVFGSCIVCSSPDIAKSITFDKSIRTRTVTLDGDSYDPSGTLTGGSKSQIGVLLGRIEELNFNYEQLHLEEKNIIVLQHQLSQLEACGSRFRDIVAHLELAHQSLHICEEKLTNSSYAQIASQISEQEKILVDFEKVMHQKLMYDNEFKFNYCQDAAQFQFDNETATLQLTKLKDAEANIRSHREQIMKGLSFQLIIAQKEASQLSAAHGTHKGHCDALEAECTAAEKDQKTLMDQQIICKRGIDKMMADIDNIREKVWFVQILF